MREELMSELVCRQCDQRFALNSPIWRCTCGGVLDIQYTPHFQPDSLLHRGSTMWRYRDAICLSPDATLVSFGEGFTPLLEVPIEGRKVWIKQDHLFPTGSYKDRGASVLISHIS